MSNLVATINSQCKVIVYSWDNRELSFDSSDTTDLSKTTRLDVSSRILNLSFTKTISSPSGNFIFTLANNTGLTQGDDSKTNGIIRKEDWKDIIKPGTWCLIYLNNNGELGNDTNVLANTDDPKPDTLRCIGYIERVSAKGMTSENGAFDVVYEVSGRDFGVVYEETVIWHNSFNYNKSLLESAASYLPVIGNTTIDRILEVVHNLFFNPGALNKKLIQQSGSLDEAARQWLLPSSLLQDINISPLLGSPSFYGNISNITKFESSSARISVVNPLDYLTGDAWSKLKDLSISELHELFTELDDDGRPQLVFRPIPWAINKTGYPRISSSIKNYLDVDRVTIEALDIIDFDLGEDDHNRKNHFFTSVSTALFSSQDNITALKGKQSVKGNEYPLQNKSSVIRHGFRPLHIQINTLTANEMLADGKADSSLLIEYNEVLVDYWSNGINFESGSITIIGKPDIKVGKTIYFKDDVDYMGDKLYYIEEYTDQFIVQENGSTLWTQTVTLTRGAEIKDLKANSGFSQRDKTFIRGGDFT